MTETLKRTPLAEAHERLGAKMVDFGGWYMPVQYEGLIPEHTAVRTAVGLFDVSHMGEVRVTGPQATDFLNYITTNDVTKLTDGQAHYTVMANEQGGIIDDLLIYRIEADHYLLVINAGTQDGDFAWMQQHAGPFNVTLANESKDTGQIAVQGPLAQQVLQRLVEIPLEEMGYYRFATTTIAGIHGIVSRTGYTGEDGFECYIAAEHTEELWNKLLEAGEPEGIKPAGLGARDSLRLEARMHLYGQDMNTETTTLEAALGWVTKLKKASDFIGKDALKAQKKAGVEKVLVGFEMIDRGIARHDYEVVDGDEVIGVVTSGTHSPTLKKAIGLAYVPKSYSKADTTLGIRIRKKVATAKVVKGPFYKRPES